MAHTFEFASQREKDIKAFFSPADERRWKQNRLDTDMHFRMGSEDAWHAFGHRFAPKDLGQGILDSPGMRSLTMEGRRPDGCKGYIRVKVEPSVKVHPGMYVNVNDHYEVADPKSVIGSDEIRTLFERSWGESLQRSAHIAYALLEKQ